jgi:hypothetical protein
VLSDRAQFWTIEVAAPPSARYGRLVMDGAWSGDICAAEHLLHDVAAAVPKSRRWTCLSTCGAFLRFDWPAGLRYQGNLDPSPTELSTLTEAAAKAVRKVLTKDLTDRLSAGFDYLTLGVDTVPTTDESIEQPHAELVCLVDLRGDSIHWTGKFYPTVGQQSSIVRFPELESHFVSLAGETVMVLGCHDLTVYSPRAQATAGGWRRNLNADFRALAAQHRPVAVLHHPHTTSKCSTWSSKWRQLEAELPCVKEYLGAGAYSFRDPGWKNRDSLARVLAANGRGATLDVVVRLGRVP